MTKIKPVDDIKKSPFYGLFQKHPWLVEVLAMNNRLLGVFRNFVSQTIGILKEFYDLHVRPFSDKLNNDDNI